MGEFVHEKLISVVIHLKRNALRKNGGSGCSIHIKYWNDFSNGRSIEFWRNRLADWLLAVYVFTHFIDEYWFENAIQFEKAHFILLKVTANKYNDLSIPSAVLLLLLHKLNKKFFKVILICNMHAVYSIRCYCFMLLLLILLLFLLSLWT